MTEANDRLIAEVRALGESVTPRQLKDLRAHKLIPSAQGPGEGQGPGRPSKAYPEGTAERVAQIRRVQRTERDVKLAELPVWLFLDGSDLDLEWARAIALERHELIAAAFPNLDNHTSNEIADSFAIFMNDATKHPSIQAMRSFVGIRAAQPSTGFTDIVEGLLWSAIGKPPSLDVRRRLTEAVPGNRADLIEGVDVALRDSSIHDSSAKLVEASADDLIWARDRRLKFIKLCEICLDPADPIVGENQVPIFETFLGMLKHGPFLDMMSVVQISYMRPMLEPIFESVNRALRGTSEEP